MRCFAVLLIVLLLACGGSTEPTVHELVSSGAHPLPIQFRSLQGGRDGYAATVVLRFDDGPAARLDVELRLRVDPQAELEGGSWEYEGPTGRAQGELRALELDFVGGQGEGASVGGRFELLEEGRPRFLLSLPLRPLRPAGYGPDAR